MMQTSFSSVSRVCACVAAFLPVVACLSGGCATMAIPCHDELAGFGPVTTPSTVAVRAADARVGNVQDRADMGRRFDDMQVSAKDGRVTHGVLYFENPVEESGSDDGIFAWTNEDYAYWITGPVRFLANIASFPVGAALLNPWVTMASDGRYAATDQSRRKEFDAQRVAP